MSLISCYTDDWGTSKYSNLPARFTCDNTAAYPILNAACNNPGSWCSITIDNTGLRYQLMHPSSATPGYIPISAGITSQAHAWVAGLVVGKPTIPEPGAIESIVTCYDIVCPNCYTIPLDCPLTITTTGYAKCVGCLNVYDLNNQGLHISGDATSTRLFRYRATYLSPALLINN